MKFSRRDIIKAAGAVGIGYLFEKILIEPIKPVLATAGKDESKPGIVYLDLAVVPCTSDAIDMSIQSYESFLNNIQWKDLIDIPKINTGEKMQRITGNAKIWQDVNYLYGFVRDRTDKIEDKIDVMNLDFDSMGDHATRPQIDDYIVAFDPYCTCDFGPCSKNVDKKYPTCITVGNGQVYENMRGNIIEDGFVMWPEEIRKKYWDYGLREWEDLDKKVITYKFKWPKRDEEIEVDGKILKLPGLVSRYNTQGRIGLNIVMGHLDCSNSIIEQASLTGTNEYAPDKYLQINHDASVPIPEFGSLGILSAGVAMLAGMYFLRNGRDVRYRKI